MDKKEIRKHIKSVLNIKFRAGSDEWKKEKDIDEVVEGVVKVKLQSHKKTKKAIKFNL